MDVYPFPSLKQQLVNSFLAEKNIACGVYIYALRVSWISKLNVVLILLKNLLFLFSFLMYNCYSTSLWECKLKKCHTHTQYYILHKLAKETNLSRKLSFIKQSHWSTGSRNAKISHTYLNLVTVFLSWCWKIKLINYYYIAYTRHFRFGIDAIFLLILI